MRLSLPADVTCNQLRKSSQELLACKIAIEIGKTLEMTEIGLLAMLGFQDVCIDCRVPQGKLRIASQLAMVFGGNCHDERKLYDRTRN